MAWAFVRLSVRLADRHAAVLCQKGASQDHEIVTVGGLKVSSFSWQNFMPLGEGVPLERKR